MPQSDFKLKQKGSWQFAGSKMSKRECPEPIYWLNRGQVRTPSVSNNRVSSSKAELKLSQELKADYALEQNVFSSSKGMDGSNGIIGANLPRSCYHAPNAILSTFHGFIHLVILKTCGEDIITTPPVWTKRLRLREMTSLAEDHTTRKQQSWAFTGHSS